MPPPSTAWSRGGRANRGGFLSDKLSQPQRPQQQKGKGQASKLAQQAPPTSPAVLALQQLIQRLSIDDNKSVSSLGKQKASDQKGCFCQAKIHQLSEYTPICSSCGLVLCSLNPPYSLCPFAECGESLLTFQQRERLLNRLNEKIAETLEREEAARIREEEEKQRQIGSFPVLPGATPRPQTQAPVAPVFSHKVLSLTGKNAILSTYTPATPKSKPSNKSGTSTPIEPQEIRVPPPALVPDHVTVKNDSFGRRFEDLRGDGPTYVPIPLVPSSSTRPKENRRPRNRKKGGKKPNTEPGGALDSV